MSAQPYSRRVSAQGVFLLLFCEPVGQRHSVSMFCGVQRVLVAKQKTEVLEIAILSQLVDTTKIVYRAVLFAIGSQNHRVRVSTPR